MSSFTESQIRSAERELADLGRRCCDYLRQEQDLNKKISDLRKELSRDKPDDSFRRMKESNIKSYESRLEDITRWHMYYEQQRESKLKELDRLRQKLDYERREDARKQDTSLVSRYVRLSFISVLRCHIHVFFSSKACDRR